MKSILGMSMVAGLALAAWLLPAKPAGACSCVAYEGETTSIVATQIEVPGDLAMFEREQQRWAIFSELQAEFRGIHLKGAETFEGGSRHTEVRFEAFASEDTGLDSGLLRGEP